MKGVILAGGTGSRLHPLTRITNKHLLPVYDKPMIFYPIETLVSAGIVEIMIVTGGNHAGEFLPLLGNGTEFGLHRLQFSFQAQAGVSPKRSDCAKASWTATKWWSCLATTSSARASPRTSSTS